VSGGHGQVKGGKNGGSAEPEVKSANVELLVECIAGVARSKAGRSIDY